MLGGGTGPCFFAWMPTNGLWPAPSVILGALPGSDNPEGGPVRQCLPGESGGRFHGAVSFLNREGGAPELFVN